MGRLRYSINITLDGCCDHRAIIPDAQQHQFWADVIAQSDALLYGRITYQMMEEAWRPIAETGILPPNAPDWVLPFARSIHAARKFAVSDTLSDVGWDTTLIRGKQLEQAVRDLKEAVSGQISLGGVHLPKSLAALGLIDEYQFVVHPHLAGHGPTLLAGLPTAIPLKLISQTPFNSGAVAMLYEAVR